jgi:soluble lytic murein transglycosylase
MRGRGSLRTRALAIWAGMLGAVLAASGNYSVAQAQSSGETGDQTALAVPRVGLRGAAGVALPQPLPPSEAALVRRIFSLQAAGSLAEAQRDTLKLQNDLLSGTILADRFLRGTYRPAPTELTAWLTHYGDQPEAGEIRELLERLSPTAALPAAGTAPTGRRLARGTRRSAGPGNVRALFTRNQDEAAIDAATPLLTVASPSESTSDALFVAGLAAWRLSLADVALGFFDAAYNGASTSWLRAASAFWAGRVKQRLSDRGGFAVWMRRAASEGDTFYGLIAERALGPSIACVADGTIGNADTDALVATPQGRRAFALLQVGEKRYAEAELRSLWVDTAQDGTFDRSVLLAARAVGFTSLAAEIERGGSVRPLEPLQARLQPAGGFVVDPPLVYALVHHESGFKPGAVSQAGARGLMQIMPRTAHAVAGARAARLQEPAVNLAIGQEYLLALADDEAVDGDLIRILAAYGQGQGGLRKWVDAVRDNGDPLMFIEAIPNAHTRGSVRDALVWSWHYAGALNLPATSLDALAAGRYPRLVRAGETAHVVDGSVCRRQSASR